MALLFDTVPNWDSWENQGPNIAIADLDNKARQNGLFCASIQPTPGLEGD